MEKQQTAVEWLVDEFKEKLTGSDLPGWVLEIINQAKQMNKEQIVLAASIAFEDMFGYDGTNYGIKYYESKYGKDEKHD